MTDLSDLLKEAVERIGCDSTLVKELVDQFSNQPGSISLSKTLTVLDIPKLSNTGSVQTRP